MIVAGVRSFEVTPICWRHHYSALITFAAVLVALIVIGRVQVAAVEGSAVGLSLFFQNSSMPAITLFGDQPRYLQEIDVVATTAPSATDQGIDPLINNSEFSSLDWRGVHMVEEDWRAPGDGTFTRQRFYRGAVWMNRES